MRRASDGNIAEHLSLHSCSRPMLGAPSGAPRLGLTLSGPPPRPWVWPAPGQTLQVSALFLSIDVWTVSVPPTWPEALVMIRSSRRPPPPPVLDGILIEFFLNTSVVFKKKLSWASSCSLQWAPGPCLRTPESVAVETTLKSDCYRKTSPEPPGTYCFLQFGSFWFK